MTSTRMKVFGEQEGVRLLIQADEGGKTAYVDLVMDVPNTENLIEMLKSGIMIHKGLALFGIKIAEA